MQLVPAQKNTYSMIKEQLIKHTLNTLKVELEGAIAATQQAHDSATHEQSKAETQYDTLGLENAYLAQGQSRRIADLSQAISLLENWKVLSFDQGDEIYLGALLTLKNINKDQDMHVFIAPAGGGIMAKLDKLNYQVITPKTPLGQSLLGLTMEECVTLNNGEQFEITAIS